AGECRRGLGGRGPHPVLAAGTGSGETRARPVRLLDEQELKPGALASAAADWEAEGRTLSWLLELAPEKRVLGLFA
ncbi:hypothetical protein ACLXBB_37155, partial [Pseudomonas aeruginosa]